MASTTRLSAGSKLSRLLAQVSAHEITMETAIDKWNKDPGLQVYIGPKKLIRKMLETQYSLAVVQEQYGLGVGYDDDSVDY